MRASDPVRRHRRHADGEPPQAAPGFLRDHADTGDVGDDLLPIGGVALPAAPLELKAQGRDGSDRVGGQTLQAAAPGKASLELLRWEGGEKGFASARAIGRHPPADLPLHTEAQLAAAILSRQEQGPQALVERRQLHEDAKIRRQVGTNLVKGAHRVDARHVSRAKLDQPAPELEHVAGPPNEAVRFHGGQHVEHRRLREAEAASDLARPEALLRCAFEHGQDARGHRDRRRRPAGAGPFVPLRLPRGNVEKAQRSHR